MNKIRKICLVLAAVASMVLIGGLLLQEPGVWKPSAVTLVVAIALGVGAVERLKSYQYTAWIIAAVVAAMIYPSTFLTWGDIDLRNKWLILVVVQLVMFGMGIQMRLRDFTGLITTWRGVLVGLACQFTVMPLSALLLTKLFQFDREIAAGIILIGSCSSGLASNVMVYIARANLALSVTLTAIATLVAPFITPFLMKVLAGTLIEIKFINMMTEIIKIVIVPIGAALLHDYLKNASSFAKRNVMIMAIICIGWLIFLFAGGWDLMQHNFTPKSLLWVEVVSFMAGAIVFGVFYHWLTSVHASLDKIMPYVSMAGIVYFTLVTTAAGRENLLQIGFLLFLSSVMHNAAGYFLGYWLSRMFRMNENDARTIAFEVGLQNGGMASGLAGAMGKLGTVGLAAAVFSPWMNISGSVLANYWRGKMKS